MYHNGYYTVNNESQNSQQRWSCDGSKESLAVNERTRMPDSTVCRRPTIESRLAPPEDSRRQRASVRRRRLCFPSLGIKLAEEQQMGEL